MLEDMNVMCNDFGKDGAETLAKALHVGIIIFFLKEAKITMTSFAFYVLLKFSIN